MPSVIETVSMLNRLLNTVNETINVVKKIRKIDEYNAREVHSYLTEIIDLLDDLIAHNFIPELIIKHWMNTLNEYRKHLFEYFSEGAGITVAEYIDDEVLPPSVLRKQLLQNLSELLEYLNDVLNSVNKQIESGAVDIYADISKISIVHEYVNQFMKFYDEIQKWLNENSDELYYYSTVTIYDVMHEIPDMRDLFKELGVYVDELLSFIKRLKMDDLNQDAQLLKNMFEQIADAPNIAELAIDEEDESVLEEYDKAFVDALSFIDNFLSLLRELLTKMRQKIVSSAMQSGNQN